jgi:cobalamin biosynthesis Mg chelatase CobN
MLALLALALFPVAAQAGSSEQVYEVEVPSVESTTHSTTPQKANPLNSSSSGGQSSSKKNNNPQAEGSATESSTENSVEPESESEEEGQKKSGGGTSAGGNNNPPSSGGGEGGGKPSNDGVGNGTKVDGGVSNAQEAPTQTGHPVSESSGASSPVVPILIAVVVLAAISIGVVLYRQRKSGQGPDRRVSSPNAS